MLQYPTSEQAHAVAPLLQTEPATTASVWVRRSPAVLSDHERISILTAPSTSEQSPLCSDIFYAYGKKMPYARSLAFPRQTATKGHPRG